MENSQLYRHLLYEFLSLSLVSSQTDKTDESAFHNNPLTMTPPLLRGNSPCLRVFRS